MLSGPWCYWRRRCTPSRGSSIALALTAFAFSSSITRCSIWLWLWWSRVGLPGSARSAAAVADRALWHAVLTLLLERLPTLTTEELMVFAGIPTDQRLHTAPPMTFWIGAQTICLGGSLRTLAE